MPWFYFSLFNLFTFSPLDNTFIELFIVIANRWLSNKANTGMYLLPVVTSFHCFHGGKKKIKSAFFRVHNFNVFTIGLSFVLQAQSLLFFFFAFWHFLQRSAHLIEKKYSFEVGTCKNSQCFSSDIDIFLPQNMAYLIPFPRKHLSTKY